MWHLLRHPLVLSGLCLPLCVFLLRRWAPKPGPAARWLWRFAMFFLFAGIAGPILSAFGHMISHDEPTLIAVAAAGLHGQPLYHAPDAADRYAILYGPVAYWVYVPPMLAHAVDLRVFQLWVGLPLLLAGLVIIRITRRAGDLLGRGLALLPYTVTVLQLSANEWAMKGDAWMLLFFSVELEVALVLPANAAVVAVAICASLLINIKATAVFLAFVPITILGRRLGTARAVQTCFLAVLFTSLPFLLPGVSANNFIYWLRISGRHGIDPYQVAKNAAFATFMALAVVVLLSLMLLEDRRKTIIWLRRRGLVVVAAMIACLTLVVTGGKVGAGIWHCGPMAPLFAWFTATLWRRWRASSSVMHDQRQSLLATLVLSQTLIGVLALRSAIRLHLLGDYPNAYAVPQHLVAQDIVSIVRTHPQTEIEMGYGDNAHYEITWQRPVLVLLGNFYSLDADAVNEMDFAGLPFPHATLDRLAQCHSQVFLIPKGDPPFSMQSLYYLSGASAPKALFPEVFRQEFLRAYYISGSSRYFDLWSCRH